MPRTRAAFGLGPRCLVALPAGPGVPAEPVRLVMPVVYGTHLPGLGEPACAACQARQAALRRRYRARPETAWRRHRAARDPRQGVARAGRRRLRHGELLGREGSGCGAVRRLSVRPRRQGLCRLVLRRQRAKLYQEMYDEAELNVHVIPCAFGGGEASGWFAKEIREPDDIKGFRMRSFGLGGRVMSRLGATTVLVPGGKLGKAFDKHEIDGAEFLTPAVDRASAPPGSREAHLRAGLASARDGVRASHQSGSLERARRSSSRRCSTLPAGRCCLPPLPKARACKAKRSPTSPRMGCGSKPGQTR